MFLSANHEITPVFFATQEEILIGANAILSEVVGRVDVKTKNPDTNEVSDCHGSCFFYLDTFHMITCAHVVKEATEIKVFFPKFGSFDANLVHYDDNLDVAVILLSGLSDKKHSLPYLKGGNEIVSGTVTFSAGYPFDKNFHVNVGSISKYVEYDTAIVTNDSDQWTHGGPVVGRLFRNLLGVTKGSSKMTPSIILALYLRYTIPAELHVPMIENFVAL